MPKQSVPETNTGAYPHYRGREELTVEASSLFLWVEASSREVKFSQPNKPRMVYHSVTVRFNRCRLSGYKQNSFSYEKSCKIM